MTVLRALIARIAIILRGMALAEMLAQVIIWHSFYLTSPWLLWGPAVALASGGAAMTGLRNRRLTARLAGADTALYAALALTAGSCVPAAMRGEAGDWLFIVVTSQVVTPIWFAPGALSAPLAAAPGVAFAIGTVLVPSTRMVPVTSRNASIALLFLVVTVHWVVRRMLCTRAVAADAGLAAADRDARDQYVILSRNIERREQDRLLHDTVLNTLTALARSGSAAAASQCRQDIAMLERAMSKPGDATAGTQEGAGLLAAIAAVLSEMRSTGLVVDLEITDDAAARADGTLPAQGAMPLVSVPALVEDALARATREALANVAAHAGTGQAAVTVSLTRPDAQDASRPDRIRITIRDTGSGFAVSQVEPGRLGLRRSITERLEDCGGSASVKSAPGHGTTVGLSWPATRDAPGSARQAAATAAGGPALPPHQAVADATESAAPRFVTAVAIALPAGLLVQALISPASYRHPIVPVVVWLGMLAAAAWLAPRARSGRLSTAHAVTAVLVAAAAVTAIGLDRKVTGASGTTIDWTILGTVWLLALIALGSPARLWVPGSALILGIHTIFVLDALGVSPLGLSRLAASAYAVVSILAVFAALRPTLRTHAEIAMRRAALASRAAAERAAAAAISQVRRDRLELAEIEMLPLLRRIADGTADPADSAIRSQCAQHAATMRRALADREPPGAAGLLASLEPALNTARSRSVPVEVQVIGDPGQPGPDVAHATCAAVDGVLRALPPQPTTLTIIASEDQVELFLTFERAPAGESKIPGLRHGAAEPRHDVRADPAWRATLEAQDAGRGCLEIRWRRRRPREPASAGQAPAPAGHERYVSASGR
jgi:signal transduction histidine kinase